MGFLREKEQKWVDAAANYEEAWKISKRRNPTIGKFRNRAHLKHRIVMKVTSSPTII